METNKFKDKPFGLEVRDIDCRALSKEQTNLLKTMLYVHQLLLIPDQGHLSPEDEVTFYRQLVGSGDTIWRDQTNNPWEVYKVEKGNQAGTFQIPAVPEVLVIGKGKVEHHELKVELGGSRSAYGADKGSQVLGGGALQWHIDGAFYDKEPCEVTQMSCLEAPKSEGRWIDYHDGTGARLWAGAGATAFASGRVAFDLLSEEDQSTAMAMKVHYAPEPFKWAEQLKNNQNGLRVVDEEAEQRFTLNGEDLPGVEFDDKLAKKYPLVWTCPHTKRKALMPHPRCMHHLEDTNNGRQLGVIESRMLVEKLMRPAINPENVISHTWKEGDLVVWNNRSIWHSATGGLSDNDRRLQHLTALDGIAPPVL